MPRKPKLPENTKAFLPAEPIDEIPGRQQFKLFCDGPSNCEIKTVMIKHPVPAFHKCLTCKDFKVELDAGGLGDL